MATLSTSYNTYNLPQMFLSGSISATQTTGIKISPLERNGVTVTFPATSGGVLRIKQGSRVEDISYGSATVDATTKEVTLVDVVRDLAWNGTGYTSNSNGEAFSKGAIVEFSIDSRLFNKSAKTDSANTFTADQTYDDDILFTGTDKSGLNLKQLTTAQRDAISSPNNGALIYNTTTGAVNQYVGGAWTEVGDTGTVDASTTVAGKMEVATDAEIRSETGAGGSGAPTVIPASATAVLKDDRLVLKDETELTISSGAITVTQPYHKVDTESDASTDDLDTITAAVGAGEVIILYAENDARTVVIKHGTGNILTADNADFSIDTDDKSITLINDGTNWKELCRGQGATVVTAVPALETPAIADATEKGVSTTSKEYITDTGYVHTVAANSISAGDTFRVRAYGEFTIRRDGPTTATINLNSDTTSISQFSVTSDGGSGTYLGRIVIEAYVTFRTIGASATTQASIVGEASKATGLGTDEFQNVGFGAPTIDTTSSFDLRWGVQFDTNESANGLTLQMTTFEKLA